MAQMMIIIFSISGRAEGQPLKLNLTEMYKLARQLHYGDCAWRTSTQARLRLQSPPEEPRIPCQQGLGAYT